MTGKNPPPGWYVAEAPDGYRWWDGEQWTEHRRPVAGVEPPDIDGAEVSTTTLTRIKWAGLRWGDPRPELSLAGGVIFALFPLGLGAWLLLGVLLGSEWSWSPQGVGVIAIVLVAGGASVLLFINAHFGYKLRRLRLSPPP